MKERCYTQSGSDNYSSGCYQPYTTTTYWNTGHYESCRCCCGSGVQRKCDGIKIICPCCNGTGKRWVNTPCYPYQPPYYHHPLNPVIWCHTDNVSSKYE
jgi:hypothetical protein